MEALGRSGFHGRRKLNIGGDFNIRIGHEGKMSGVEEEEKGKQRCRASKDKVSNNGSKRMLEIINKKGWTIASENLKGDEEGEFTYIGARGSTVIDYVIVNEKAKEKIQLFKGV